MSTDPVEALRALLDARHTMVLATADPAPWCAPVYFVRHADRLCFFSSPDSRHLRAVRDGRLCAASVFRDGDDWRDIEGVQMTGRVEPVETGPLALAAFAAYLAKFPVVREMMPAPIGGTEADLERFAARFRSTMHAFVPADVHYLCNRLGFGTRREVAWPR